MHEWALAESVIESAKKIAAKKELKEVKEIIVKIGELQQVEEDILFFAFNQLKDGIFKKANIIIIKAKTKLSCRLCGNKWTFRKQNLDEVKSESIHFVPEVAHAYIKCPNCGSPDFKIASGRGIWLERIKGVQ